MARDHEQTIQEWLIQATDKLKDVSDTADLDAKVLLSFHLQKPNSYLFTWPEHKLDLKSLSELDVLLQRRGQGEPIAYITGKKEFWSLELIVSDKVLIPRPETEHLVEWALENAVLFNRPKILDLGTGSGAIALALAKELPEASITASDISIEALNIAKANAKKHQFQQINFIQSNWFDAIDAEPFDIIVSNPPYIAKEDPHLEQGDLPFEPIRALVAEEAGFADLKLLIKTAREYLNNNGWLAIEHGHQQSAAVRLLFEKANYHSVHSHPDLAGIERFTVGCWRHSNE